jgi:hypothetical protein
MHGAVRAKHLGLLQFARRCRVAVVAHMVVPG